MKRSKRGDFFQFLTVICLLVFIYGMAVGCLPIARFALFQGTPPPSSTVNLFIIGFLSVFPMMLFMRLARSYQAKPVQEILRTWKFASDKGIRVVQMYAFHKRIDLLDEQPFRLVVFIDEIPIFEDRKKKPYNYQPSWENDYQFPIDSHFATLKVKSQRVDNAWDHGFLAEFDLVVDGQHIPSISEHMPVALSLPPVCSSCGAPVYMQQLRWTGPLQAACRFCGANIQAEIPEISQ